MKQLLYTAAMMMAACWHSASAQPLMDKHTKEIPVVKMFKYAEIKTWSFALPNGVLLVMRPADSVKNILINGFANGGASGLPAADYASAVHAGQIIGSSGVGKWNAAALEPLLKDQQVHLNASITGNLSSINGVCTRESLETALQLIYLYFTSPRRDTQACNQYIQQLKNTAANMPAQPLADTLNALRYGNDGMHKGLAAEAAEISLDKVMLLWQRFFGNARGYTFVFTGDLDPNSMNHSRLEPLVSRYLGALPSSNDTSNRPPLSAMPSIPKGGISKKIYSGKGAMASASVIYSGGYAYSDSANLQLKALTWILRRQLMTNAKTAGMDVQSFNLFSMLAKDPQPQYSYQFNIQCPARHMPALLQLMHAITDSLQQQVPEEAVQAFITDSKNMLRQQYTDNNFWQIYLTRAFIKHDDPYDIAHYPYFFRKATTESLRQTARMMWRNQPFIEIVQLPFKIKTP